MAQRQRSGAEMLKEIPVETAQQMFNAIRYQTDPPGSTMIPDLDEYILKSLDSAPSLHSSLNRGDIIEIQGPAASGKTQLLYHLVATCTLPSELVVSSLDVQAELTIPLGGWQKSTIILDCDGRWDIRRLYSILVSRIQRACSVVPLPPLPHKSDTSTSSIALETLSRLHFFRPTSSLQLAATLLTLPKYHEERMPHEEIRMLLVDSISSFYWADRWQAELSSTKTPLQNPLGDVLRSIQAFRLSHGPVTILTNWGLNPHSAVSSASSGSLTPFFKQHLPSPFPAPLDEPPLQLASGHPSLILTCHITLSHTPIPPLRFNPKSPNEVVIAGLEEGLDDERTKQTVQKGEISGYVRNPRPQRTQDTTVRSNFGRFTFRILENDVVASA